MKKVIFRLIIFLLLIFTIISCSQKKEIEIEVEEIDPFIYKTGSLKSGETLAKALIKKDIDNVVVYKMVNKLDSIYDLRKSHPADSFIVRLDSLDIVHELTYIPDKITSFHVIRDTSENYFTRIDSLPVTKTIEKCDGVILSSLYKAMIDEGESAALPVMFSQIFQWDIDFFIDPQKGDEFHLVYEKISCNNEFIDYGEILIAQYKSKNYDNTAYSYKNKKGITKYYNEKGESFQKAFLKSPLNYKRISSYFGKRHHPITKKVSMHNGVDYAAAYGTPVEAAADGTVIKASWNKRHTGETVKIRHTNGYVTLYGHLSKYGKYRTGDRVKQHDVIGYVGSTGRSTGPHLHYTIYHHGKAINPLKLKNVSGPPVPKTEMADFKVVLDSLKSLLNTGQHYSFEEKGKND